MSQAERLERRWKFLVYISLPQYLIGIAVAIYGTWEFIISQTPLIMIVGFVMVYASWFEYVAFKRKFAPVLESEL